jgi:hypothetical protein
VIEKSEDINGRVITNYIKFQCTQDRTQMVDRFNTGQEVKVLFNIKGSRWEKDGKTNYITNLDAWRMEPVNLSQQGTTTDNIPDYDAVPPANVPDDLPF